MLRIGYAQAHAASRQDTGPPVSGRARSSAASSGPPTEERRRGRSPAHHASPITKPTICQLPSEVAADVASRRICWSSALSVIRMDSTSRARRLVS